LHRVSLLEYPALFVFEYTFSPNPIVVSTEHLKSPV